jgi:hypothetical protein
MMALYVAHAQTPAFAADFWEIVAEKMQEQGFQRTPDECQRRWFQVLPLLHTRCLSLGFSFSFVT